MEKKKSPETWKLSLELFSGYLPLLLSMSCSDSTFELHKFSELEIAH